MSKLKELEDDLEAKLSKLEKMENMHPVAYSSSDILPKIPALSDLIPRNPMFGASASTSSSNPSVPSLVNSPLFENLRKSVDAASSDSSSQTATRGATDNTQMDLSASFLRNGSRNALNSNIAQSLGRSVSQLLQQQGIWVTFH